MKRERIEELENKLTYRFNDISLLKQALTHSSYSKQDNVHGLKSNEILEFLGDSLLNMSIALLIYERKPELNEGEMTFLRADLVCEKNLASLGMSLDLSSYMYLGKSVINSRERNRASILADAIEAVIAAVYLDGGHDALEQVIDHLFIPQLDKPLHKDVDYKSTLQNITQSRGKNFVSYKLMNTEGPAHNRIFNIKVEVGGKFYGSGKGKSKKLAEQEAAKEAVERLRSESDKK